MRALLITLILICATYGHINTKNITADLVIYSYNRPLQLYALLESTYKYITGLETITVIYRASDECYTQGYQTVSADFPAVKLTKQGTNPKQDFKPLTLDAVFKSPTDYILFAVDDIIVKDYVKIPECIDLLEKTNAYGFYLRLGTNITYSYTQNKKINVPNLKNIKDNIYAWQFARNQSYWGYPNTVDMTLYRKSDITHDLHTLNYTSPNTFEGAWAGKAGSIQSRFGLCYKNSKIINIPLNKVQQDFNNIHMNAFSPAELLTLFIDGFKIDIQPFYRINNPSAHTEYEPLFIKR